MDSNKAQELADILEIDVEHAKDFVNSLTVSELAALNTNLENGNIDDIKSFFRDYKDTHGDESDLDIEYAVRQNYQELLDKGYDKEVAASRTEKEFSLTKDDLESLLHGWSNEYTNEHDSQINSVLEKIESLKKGIKLEGSILKGLNAQQIEEVIARSKHPIGEAISTTLALTQSQVRKLYSKSQGFNYGGLLENKLSSAAMRDSLLESELNKLFEAMKNKWHKRSYWRKRPDEAGFGTVGVDGFDFYSILDPHNDIKSDDYGVITVKKENVNTLKKYIVDNSKKK